MSPVESNAAASAAEISIANLGIFQKGKDQMKSSLLSGHESSLNVEVG